jgi:hypothetical protein
MEVTDERNLIVISITGERDCMACRVCGVSEPIPNEYISGARLTTETGARMSLVLGRGERRKIIREFRKYHLQKCLLLSGAGLKAALKVK